MLPQVNGGHQMPARLKDALHEALRDWQSDLDPEWRRFSMGSNSHSIRSTSL